MKRIGLTRGKEAWVSDKDFAYLNRWSWCFSEGYAVRGSWRDGRNITVRMHLVVAKRMGLVTRRDIDHRNRKKLDNRRSNLRAATRQQTSANVGRRVDNTSGFKGVSKFRDKWQAGIRVNGKREHLGHFNSKIAAARAYNKRALEAFGPFACINKLKAA